MRNAERGTRNAERVAQLAYSDGERRRFFTGEGVGERRRFFPGDGDGERRFPGDGEIDGFLPGDWVGDVDRSLCLDRSFNSSFRSSLSSSSFRN